MLQNFWNEPYVAFNGEECGFVGSKVLVESLGSSRPERTSSF